MTVTVSDDGHGELTLSGGAVRFAVRRSLRATRLRLNLAPDGTLTLTVPQKASMQDAEKFMENSIPWIERHIRKRAVRQPRPPCGPAWYPDHFHFLFSGEEFPIQYEWKNVCWVGARENNGTIVVSGSVLNPDAVHDILKRFLIRKAETVFPPLLAELAESCGFSYRNVSVRFQRGRWGSCSGRRNISLNAQMLFLSPEEVRYVMIHELCHTRQMNHSGGFWREVGKCCPDFQRIQAGLRRKEPELWR